MLELPTADMIGTEFRHKPRIKSDHLLGLARPPALSAWGPTGKALSVPQRLEK